jgi:hypothetical protein
VIIETNRTWNRTGTMLACPDIETAQAAGVNPAILPGSSFRGARFQNHFPDAPPPALGNQLNLAEKKRKAVKW